MSASAQFSSETSAVSKEVANLSLWIFSLNFFWSVTFSILPSRAKSHWTSDPNACSPTKKTPQTRENYSQKVFLMKKICSSCAPVALTYGLWPPNCLPAGRAEIGDDTALTPLPLLPPLHQVRALGREATGHSWNKRGMFSNHGRCAAGSTSLLTLASNQEPHWSHLLTSVLASRD